MKIDYHVIRGLAYYTGVVFEAFDRKGEFRAIAGGGRYDNLVKLISGGKVDLPALGFGMGDVVLLELLKARGLLPKFDAALDVFCLIEDEALRAESLKLVQDLRAAGLVGGLLRSRRPNRTSSSSAPRNSRPRTPSSSNAIAAGELLAKIKNLKTRQESVVPLPRLPRGCARLQAEAELRHAAQGQHAADPSRQRQ